MNNSIKIEDLPEEIKKEVLDYAEYLMQKYRVKKNGIKWFEKVNRGISSGEMASETIEKIRKENRW